MRMEWVAYGALVLTVIGGSANLIGAWLIATGQWRKRAATTNVALIACLLLAGVWLWGQAVVWACRIAGWRIVDRIERLLMPLTLMVYLVVIAGLLWAFTKFRREEREEKRQAKSGK